AQYRLREGEGARKRGRHARPRVTRRHGRAHEGARRSDLPLRADDARRRRHPSRDATRHVRSGRGQGRRRTSRLHLGRLRQSTDGHPSLRQHEVEEHIAKIGVRATVLAPVYFMENLHFGKEQLAKGIYATPLPPTRQLAQVAVADIGAVAVRRLEDPGRFTRKRFDLESDELTGNDVLAILSRVIGRPFTYFQVPLDVIRQRMGEDGAKMYEWFDRVGFTVDRAALRREFPDVAFHDFECGAKAQDWNTLLQGA